MAPDSATLEPGASAVLPLPSFAPAAKIAAAVAFSVCASLLSRHGTALAACCIPFLLAVAGRLPVKTLLRRLVPINFFFIFLWAFLPIRLSAGALMLSGSGFELAALITLKGNAVAAMLLTLVGTSTVGESCRGLLRLRLPEKLVTLLLLTYSNLAHMMKEHAKIAAAAKLRGFTSASSLAGCKTAAYLAAMLLARSWQRSGRVGNAMRLRGFSGKYPLLELPPAIPYNKYGSRFFMSVCFGSILLLFIDIFL